MAAKIQNDLNGWLVIDKPYGMGSTQVVSKLKWLLKPKKIGHAGTLDPLATGVLPIALGKATKTIPFVMDGMKAYHFTVQWGRETSTDDVEGEVIATSDKRPTLKEIEAALPSFLGDIAQVPPQYSALKIDGKRAYDLARAGVVVEMKPRMVHIEALHVLNLDEQEGWVTFEVICGKGTYVRSIGHDLGRKLGCYGHITMLRRTRSGPFTLDESILLANMEKNDYNTNALSILPLGAALSDISVLAVNKENALALIQGREINVSTDEFSNLSTHAVIGLSYQNQIIALARGEKGILKPFRVLAEKINS